MAGSTHWFPGQPPSSKLNKRRVAQARGSVCGPRAPRRHGVTSLQAGSARHRVGPGGVGRGDRDGLKMHVYRQLD